MELISRAFASAPGTAQVEDLRKQLLKEIREMRDQLDVAELRNREYNDYICELRRLLKQKNIGPLPDGSVPPDRLPGSELSREHHARIRDRLRQSVKRIKAKLEGDDRSYKELRPEMWSCS